MTALWPWLALCLLGAYHGINPGMGWLFAVSLGLQEQSRQAVLRALPPIALGHALSIGLVVLLAGLAQASLPHWLLRYAAAAILFGFGLFRLVRSRHPAWVGMRVGFRDLTVWSFVMASAHGAGLMLLPILLGGSTADHAMPLHHDGTTITMPASHPMDSMAMDHMEGMEHHPAGRPPDHATAAPSGEHTEHMKHLLAPNQMATFASPPMWLAAVVVHTLAHLLVAGLVALLVYEKLGLGLLRQAWFNMDLLWTLALMLSGLLILFV